MFFIYSVLAPPPKKSPLLFNFDIFDGKNIQPASQSHAYVIVIFFTILEGQHQVFTSLLLSTGSGQDKTLTHVKKFAVC